MKAVKGKIQYFSRNKSLKVQLVIAELMLHVAIDRTDAQIL